MPGLAAAVVNAGAAKTDIMRSAPWYMRAGAKTLGLVIFDSVETSAHNAVESVRRDDWQGPTYWGKPGRFEQRTPIRLNAAASRRLMDISSTLTGA
ncbi:hypothetical protein [Streptomyces sp. NPDC058142]|uniref:hypothetical protein n=1 Tax=Streptomyces sp. NPDC058142 TaxID=3346355 RepID=UPI0036F18FB1